MTEKTKPEAVSAEPAISEDWLDVFADEDSATSGLDLSENRIELGNGAFMRGAAHCEDFGDAYSDYSLYE